MFLGKRMLVNLQTNLIFLNEQLCRASLGQLGVVQGEAHPEVHLVGAVAAPGGARVIAA